MPVDIVQEIKLRTDLVELISQYVPLRASGRTHKGLCPFHTEKTPSFHVDGERGFFKCYGCGKGGDCFTFLQEREGLNFNEAGEMLARRLGMEWVRRGETSESRSQRERLHDINTLADRFFRQSLERAPQVREYLLKRGLTEETIVEFGLGYAPPGYEALLRWLKGQKVSLEDAEAADLVLRGEQGMRDRFVDRVMFPIADVEGRTVAFGGRTLRPDGIPKYLNSRETALFQKSKTLYGLHLAKRAIPGTGFAVVVEGYMDLIALHQAGIANSVACLGTAIGEAHVGILRRYLPNPTDRLVLCLDGDSAGMRAALRGSAMFEAAGCNVHVARLPEGADPDTYLQQHGADQFRALLTRAEPLLDYQLNALRARYNLSDSSNRLPFVREAAGVIAQSGSHLTRQEYAGKLTAVLDRLADEWYPASPQQSLQARMALRQEVSRLLRTERFNGRNARPATPDSSVADATSSARPTAQSRAERYVVRAALTEPRWAEQVASRLTASHFAEGELTAVVDVLTGVNGSAELPPAERARRVSGDPELAGLVSGLLLDESPLSDEGVEECLQSLERAWKQARKQELQRLLEAGELSSDDPRYEELRGLLVGLGGRQRRED